MFKSILNFSFLITIIQNVTGILGIPEGDCSYYVTSGNVTYKGCKISVSTESLKNPPFTRKDIYVFKGMPYAKPPVGVLRFAKPVRKMYSSNTSIDATDFGPACMQSLISPISEDCLFINVYTPTLNSSAKLPVMFCIHGGSFFGGSGTFNGSQLALRDVILIFCNYRLGVFGFLYGNRSDSPGNVGLWDQALALKWTINNIRAFGGDPNQITVFGESSGSISASYLCISNHTRNLFQRVIFQSGTGYIKTFNRDPDFVYKSALSLASDPRLQCNFDINLTECLRTKNATVLLDAQLSAIAFNPSGTFNTDSLYQFVPMYGDFYDFMPKSIPQAMREGDFRRDINYFIGHNEMEGAIFAQNIGQNLLMSSRYDPKTCPNSSTLISELYPILSAKYTAANDINNIFLNRAFGRTPGRKYTKTFSEIDLQNNITSINRLRGSAAHALGDFLITCPTILYGYYTAKFQIPTKKVFQYRLTYSGPLFSTYGSCWANTTHADDLTYVFGYPFIIDIFTSDDKNMSAKMMDIFTTFAKTDGLPKVNGIDWPPYIVSCGVINLTYVELHPSSSRFGRIFSNRYDGIDDGFKPKVINNCLYFWDCLLYGQF